MQFEITEAQANGDILKPYQSSTQALSFAVRMSTVAKMQMAPVVIVRT